jgi:bifunctional pyridoxal-dependent enzyme with beta-cystathionase and maltose regulon repressor activities
MKGVDLAIRFFSAPEDPVVIPMPVYMPFFDVVALTKSAADCRCRWRGTATRHTFDLAAIDAALAAGGRTVLISSPHNPLGRVFTRERSSRGSPRSCERHGARVISDEIHAPLVLDRPAHPVCRGVAGRRRALDHRAVGVQGLERAGPEGRSGHHVGARRPRAVARRSPTGSGSA